MTRLPLFAAAMDVADPALADHATRVARSGRSIVTRLDWSPDQIARLELGAALHDVGKIAVPPDVLGKPGPLDEAELAAIRAHPVEGLWLIAGVPSLASALPYVLFHHERWDGSGYPTRRSRTAIPIEGRVMAVADAFDAMTTHRPYKAALPFEAAVDEVRRCTGTQFDPEIACAFFDAVDCGEIAPSVT